MLWQGELNRAKQKIARNNNFMFGILDIKGSERVPFIYDWVWALDDTSLYKAEKGDKIGFIDTLGKVVIPFLYSSIDDFDSQGMARAVKDGKYVYINKMGIEYRYFY